MRQDTQKDSKSEKKVLPQKISREIVRKYQTICVEGLQIHNTIEGSHYAKSKSGR